MATVSASRRTLGALHLSRGMRVGFSAAVLERQRRCDGTTTNHIHTARPAVWTAELGIQHDGEQYTSVSPPDYGWFLSRIPRAQNVRADLLASPSQSQHGPEQPTRFNTNTSIS
jgi:hypothetical protein